jgi:hypothetical protein
MMEITNWWPYFDTLFERPQPMRPGDGLQSWFPSFLRDGSRRKIHGTCILPPDYELAFVPRDAKVVSITKEAASLSAERVTELRERPRPSTASSTRRSQTAADANTGRETEDVEETEAVAQLESNAAGENAENTAPATKTQLSTSSGTVKALIALLQSLYAASTLYRSRGNQIDMFGYAAFGLTVAPYILMSAINLAGNLLTPNFPALYLVQSDILTEAMRRPDTFIDGQVGQLVRDTNPAYNSNNSAHPPFERDWVTSTETSTQSSSQEGAPCFPLLRGFRKLSWLSCLVFIIISFTVASTPLFIVGFMSHFRRGMSTYSERVWIMTWFALGIFIGPPAALFAALLDYRGRKSSLLETEKFLYLMFAWLVFAAPAIGSFVVVGQMMRTYGECITLY